MVFLLIFILSRFSTFDPRCARPEKGNSHPPAQPGVLHMRAKPYFTGCASRRSGLSHTCNGASHPLPPPAHQAS